MLKTWMNVNVNIEVATRLIEDFFKKRNFNVHDKRLDNNVVINAFNNMKNISFIIKVRNVENLFEVEFVPKELGSLRYFGNLFSTFGGGSFVLKTLKSGEVAEKIENEFWTYVFEIIEEIKVSSKLK
jgi:hypothetical protein